MPLRPSSRSWQIVVGLIFWSHAVFSFLNVLLADAKDTCCSRMIRTNVANVAGRFQSGGLPCCRKTTWSAGSTFESFLAASLIVSAVSGSVISSLEQLIKFSRQFLESLQRRGNRLRPGHVDAGISQQVQRILAAAAG